MMNKKDQKKFNIYEFAGKTGNTIKKYGGYALSVGVTLAISKGPDLLKRMKKS